MPFHVSYLTWIGDDYTENTWRINHLGGNVRRNPRLSGTTHNVFEIQAGVSINVLVRSKQQSENESAKILYSRFGEYSTKEQKLDYLQDKQSVVNVDWEEINPDKRYNWLTKNLRSDFENFAPMGTKRAKRSQSPDAQALFSVYSGGVKTNRDAWAYNFDAKVLDGNMQQTIEIYNAHVDRWIRLASKPKVDGFVDYDDSKLKWSGDLKIHLKSGRPAEFSKTKIRQSLYRPFTRSYLFFDRILNNRVYLFPRILPSKEAEVENRVIAVTNHSQIPFVAQMTNLIPCIDVGGRPTQCFPFYTYNEDGRNRRENITDWALEQFQTVYGESSVSKWDIFHYIYALLHHPDYRETYAANLRRELPRIPFVRDFWGFVRAGERLAEIHVHYEEQSAYPLQHIEDPDLPLDYRVEKMRLSRDKSKLKYNDFLTLAGIPPKVYEYKLGNRSALEWVIDQYQVKTDKRSGITNDPNRPEDETYILRLVKQVITVSLETVTIVEGLPGLEIRD